MMLSVLLLTALLGLFGTCISQTMPQVSNGVVQSGQSLEFCTASEMLEVYNKCLYDFGAKHRHLFGYLAMMAPVCRAEVFSCQAADEMVRCLNSQPTTTISNQCWTGGLRSVMSKAFRDHNIPCRFEDVEQRCGPLRITELIPASLRSSTGQGQNTRPSSILRDLIFGAWMSAGSDGMTHIFGK